MADAPKGGPIVKTEDLDALIKQGESSQQRREEAMTKRQREEEKTKKADEMQKLAEDAGTVSQQNRGKGV